MKDYSYIDGGDQYSSFNKIKSDSFLNTAKFN